MKTNENKKLGIQPLVSILMMVIGMLLMVFKIYADSEPGAIPLLLIIAGVAWYIITRVQVRSQS